MDTLEEDSRRIGCVFLHTLDEDLDALDEDLDTLDVDLETLYVYFLNTLEEDLENLKFCILGRRCGLGLLVINITPMVIPH